MKDMPTAAVSPHSRATNHGVNWEGLRTLYLRESAVLEGRNPDAARPGGHGPALHDGLWSRARRCAADPGVKFRHLRRPG